MDDGCSQAAVAALAASAAAADQHHLLGALQEAELQNERLRNTLGIMRGEMETLQSAAAVAAEVVLPQDVSTLQAELQVPDRTPHLPSPMNIIMGGLVSTCHRIRKMNQSLVFKSFLCRLQD
jgi:hypothetical protein